MSATPLKQIIDSLQVTEVGKKYIPFDAGCRFIMENGLSSLFNYLQSGDEGHAVRLNRQTFSIIYAVVYTLCTQPAPNNFMKNIYDIQIDWNKTFLENIRDDIRVQPNMKMKVERYSHHWNNYLNILMKWYLNFFVFIQHSYIPFNNLPHLDTQLIQQWRTIIYEEFKMDIMNYFMTEMNTDRVNETVDNPALTNYIKIFTLLTDENMNTMYNIDFEKFFLHNSSEFFDGIKGTWRSSHSNMNYCAYIYSFMNAEKARVSRYLIKSTEKSLMDLIIDRFITSIHREILVDSSDGFLFYLNSLNKDNLEIFTQIYGVMSLVPNNQGIETMSSIMREFVLDKVRTKILELIASHTKVNELNHALSVYMMDIQSVFSLLIHQSFSDNSIIQTMFVNTMKTIMNDNTYPNNVKFNKHIPMFIHSTFRNKDKEFTEDMRTEVILQMIILTKYIVDKDVMIEFFKNYLKERLLAPGDINIELEQTVISRLNALYGMSLCDKLTGMLNDFIRCNTADNVSHIYTESHWPNLVNTPNLRLPGELREIYQHAESTYLSPFMSEDGTSTSREVKFSRKVKWFYTYGQLLMDVYYPKGKKYTFQFNPLQYVVFNQFMGHNNPIHYDTLLQDTGIEVNNYLDRVLDSLIRPKLIIKNESDNTYRFNPSFTSQRNRVVIQCLPFVEVTVARETIEIDRTHSIQATIVRLMKIRKTLSHNELVSNVMSELIHFQPDIKTIRLNIEALIEKEYLERDQRDNTLYKYLA